MLRHVLPSCVLITMFASLGNAATPPAAAPTVTAGKLAPEAAAPTIDGRVNDEVWKSVEPQTTFVQQDPIEGDPASEKTEVRILIGQGNVYVGIICYDSEPSKIIVSQARRDATLTDTDSVILVFDTFNDSQNAFVFGTNPIGIEYDGQVAGEGQTGGSQAGGGGAGGGGGGGSQRGGISAFNPNWDGDWTVRSAITERGWETELAIPLKTLRYATGANRTWGFNVMRNIRRKNEQVYLAAIPRGFDIYRVSLAAKLTDLDLPGRRDVKLIPYALASANKDYTLAPGSQLDRNGDVGLDVKWGLNPNLTLDFTVNTDFAQVEADEEQVNLTRFDLFFPEKRPFFLENASTFQFGNPQQIDLFFSRRVGLSGLGSSGVPLDIHGGARLSGKIGGWRVGLLDIQTGAAEDANGRLLAPGNNFGVARVQREVGRSSFGGIYVNRQGTGSRAGADNWNRAYGVDANIALSQTSRVFAFIAGTTSPGSVGTDTAGRLFYDFRNNLWQISGGYSQVGTRFNPEVGFLPRRGYRRPEFRAFLQYQPKRWQWIRRISPHASYDAFHDLHTGDQQTARAHLHFFEIQPANGGRFGNFVDITTDNPVLPFTVYNTGGKRVVIPPGKYTWKQFASEYFTDPSAVLSVNLRHFIGGFYDGDFNSVQLTSNARVGSRFLASLGWTRQHVELPYGEFTTDLVPVKASYAFTTLASVQALVQYNSQTSQFSSNIRLALLNRSGTGLFVVYNDRQDTTTFTPEETLGRSFVVKYTRLIDF